MRYTNQRVCCRSRDEHGERSPGEALKRRFPARAPTRGGVGIGLRTFCLVQQLVVLRLLGARAKSVLSRDRRSICAAPWLAGVIVPLGVEAFLRWMTGQIRSDFMRAADANDDDDETPD